MNKTIELLDAYKDATGCKSDNAAAERLGVQRATVSKWRNGIGHPEANTVETMARTAGRSAAKWVPLIEAERARTQQARATWLRIAGTAASVLLVLGGMVNERAEAYSNHYEIRARVYICKSAKAWHGACLHGSAN